MTTMNSLTPFPHIRNTAVQGVGFLPLIPLVLLGGGLIVGAGGTYMMTRPSINPVTGQPNPTALERGASAIGTGIGTAIVIATVIIVGARVFDNRRRR
jgi:hypothetical protein